MDSTNILQFPKQQKPFHDFLDELKDLYDKGIIHNFVAVCRCDFKADEEKAGSAKLAHYWFGNDSTIHTLGLLSYMEGIVRDYMRENG